MLKMLDASYEHLTPADVGEFEELLHLGDDYVERQVMPSKARASILRSG